MKRRFLFLFLLLPTLLFASSFPVQNIQVPKTTVIEETGDVLTLRGAAVHKLFFQDQYIGAFYSLNVLHDPQQALADNGPKRMWLYFLQSTDTLKSDWDEAIKVNNPPEIYEREQISISQFLKTIDTPMRPGDTLMLDYIPNIGTRVVMKGSVRDIIKGDEFYSLILKTWMGRQPPSEKFRKDLFKLS